MNSVRDTREILKNLLEFHPLLFLSPEFFVAIYAVKHGDFD